MQKFFEDPEDLGPALAMAEQRLAQFEREVLSKNVLVRLRASAPSHPFLLLRFLFLFLATIGLSAGVGVMVAPLVSRELAQQVGRIDAMFSLPLPAVAGLLAGGFLLFALGAHLAALVAGRSAPLLPSEARVHQRLVSDVKRLEAQLAVSARLTPAPPGHRMQAY